MLRMLSSLFVAGWIGPVWCRRTREAVSDLDVTEAVSNLDVTMDFPWVPIEVYVQCGSNCDAYVQCGSASARDDPSYGGSHDAPYSTIHYAVQRRAIGQTIHVMEGTCVHDAPVRLNGVEDLVIKAYHGHAPKITFADATAAFVGRSVRRVRFEGLEIEGPNAHITYEQAMRNRDGVIAGGRSTLAGKGIAIWSGDHIEFSAMQVHHCPAAGIRVNRGDYIVIQDSEVYSNCWWSTTAESAIVYAESEAVDHFNGVKMVMRRNRVYDNMNKIPYYNPNYAWSYSTIGSGVDCQQDACNPESASFSTTVCPWQCKYGKSYQDYIIDGQGVYVTRNQDTYTHGRMWLANNEAYGNGINGLMFHRTDNGMIKNNIIYDNGVLPRNTGGTEDWQRDLTRGRQPYAGMTINNANSVTLQGNIVTVSDSSDMAYAMSYDHGSSTPSLNAASTGNAVCSGRTFEPELGPSGLFETPACSDSDFRCCF